MRLVAAGLDFRTAPVTVRERAAVSAQAAPTVLRWLVGHAGVTGAVVLSTCNRTEYYLSCPTDELAATASARLGRYLDGAGQPGARAHLIERRDADALHHLFRVSAGLESMVVGEAQVLGQVRSAHQCARAAGTLDAPLDYVFRRAISVGKRVRTQTTLGRGAGSLGDVAVEALRVHLGGLAGRGVLIIGAGTMAGIAGARLHAAGASLLVCSLRGASARQLAEQWGGAAVNLDDLQALAGRFDAVISSTGHPGAVLDVGQVVALQRGRQARPLCIIDLAVPRNVAPAVAQVEGVTLFDVDDLGRQLEHQPHWHPHHGGAAERIVGEDVAGTIATLGERDHAAPAIAALTQRAEAMRSAEVERVLARLDDGEAVSRTQLDAVTRSLVRKLLHAPIAHLRESGDDPAAALWLREAFALDAPRAIRAQE